MAIRLDASADKLSRSANLPSSSAFTFGGWFKFASTPGTYSNTIFDLSANTNNYIYLQAESGTMKLWGYLAGSDQGSLSLNAYSTGTWYYYAASRNGTSFKAYYGAVGAALTEVSGTWAATTFTPSLLQIGDSVWTNEWTDGTLAYPKLWDGAQLTLAELEQERYIIRPARTANLYGWWPTPPGAAERARDYSGNGYHWTEGGTLTDEVPPPVRWSSRPIILSAPAAASGVTATAAATLAALTVSSAANTTNTASGAATLATFTVTSAATMPAVGTGSATLDAVTVASAANTTNTATGTATLSAVAVSSAATMPVVGTAAATLDALTVSSAAELGSNPITAAGNVTLAAVTVSSAATMPVVATASATVDALTVTSAANTTNTATGSATLAAVTVTSSATLTIVATGAATLAGIAYVPIVQIVHYRSTQTVIMPYEATYALIVTKPYEATYELILPYEATHEVLVT